MTTPSMEKSPPELVERFATVLDRHPDLERRKMFGYPAGFIGGNLATSLFHDRWVVRLAEPDREELLRLEGAAQFEPMPGRAMKGFALVPPSIVEDDTAIDGWVDRAIAHARSLPAKK